MIEVVETSVFAGWLRSLRDREARGRIVARIRRGDRLVVLLAGGDKRTQRRDITRAIETARTL